MSRFNGSCNLTVSLLQDLWNCVNRPKTEGKRLFFPQDQQGMVNTRYVLSIFLSRNDKSAALRDRRRPCFDWNEAKDLYCFVLCWKNNRSTLAIYFNYRAQSSKHSTELYLNPLRSCTPFTLLQTQHLDVLS